MHSIQQTQTGNNITTRAHLIRKNHGVRLCISATAMQRIKINEPHQKLFSDFHSPWTIHFSLKMSTKNKKHLPFFLFVCKNVNISDSSLMNSGFIRDNCFLLISEFDIRKWQNNAFVHPFYELNNLFWFVESQIK